MLILNVSLLTASPPPPAATSQCSQPQLFMHMARYNQNCRTTELFLNRPQFIMATLCLLPPTPLVEHPHYKVETVVHYLEITLIRLIYH